VTVAVQGGMKYDKDTAFVMFEGREHRSLGQCHVASDATFRDAIKEAGLSHLPTDDAFFVGGAGIDVDDVLEFSDEEDKCVVVTTYAADEDSDEEEVSDEEGSDDNSVTVGEHPLPPTPAHDTDTPLCTQDDVRVSSDGAFAVMMPSRKNMSSADVLAKLIGACESQRGNEGDSKRERDDTAEDVVPRDYHTRVPAKLHCSPSTWRKRPKMR